MRKKRIRLVSAALAVCMMASTLPVGAFAAAIEQAETGVATGEQEEDVIPEGDIEINSKNFPSWNFLNYVSKNFDNNPKDGKLSQEEREAVTSINVLSKKCESLRGIEYFPNLEHLACAVNNRLTSLDVSHNKKLKRLICYDCALTKLDVSNNLELTELNCNDNNLTSLDVSNNTKLIGLYCIENKLTELDVSNNLALRELYCDKNDLSILNVDSNIHLWGLGCANNKLQELNLNNNTELYTVRCGDNQLTTLDVSKNPALGELRCDNNKLKELDLSNNAKLRKLSCSGNDWVSLDVTNNPQLQELWCQDIRLKTLDLSKNPLLEFATFMDSDFTTLDVSNNPKLQKLYVVNTQLKELDVSNNLDLEVLNCSGNQLTELDVSKNTKLTHLICEDNQLTALNLINNHIYGSNLKASGNRYKIVVGEDGKFDLIDLPKSFDITKTDEWQGGGVVGTTLTVKADSNVVTYKYDTGDSNVDSVMFTLDVHRHNYQWKYDVAKHWKECVNEGCPDNARQAEGPHIYTNAKDIDCNTCGYVRPMYTVTTGENVTAELEDEALKAPVAAGTEVTLTANTDPEGKTFHGWKLYKVENDTETEITDEAELAKLLNGEGRIVTLTVPAYNVKAVPDYDSIQYTITPKNCTVTRNNVEVDAAAKGDVITATPNEQGPGKKFTGWKVTKTVNGKEVDITDELRDVSQNGLTIAELTMPAADVTIEARFDDDSGPDLDQPGVTDDGSGDIVAGVVIGGIAAVGAYEVGTGLYRITQMDDVAMPANRIALAKLLWERAGKPEPESTALYSDISAEDTDAQKAARWAVEQELLKDDTNEDEQKFHPAFPVSKLRVCLTWEKAKQKGLFDQNTEA